ncbi:MAG: AAA family ATPase [Bacteroidales bacterium]|nr:AAA family ATPase [Bacteroidales bacterium]
MTGNEFLSEVINNSPFTFTDDQMVCLKNIVAYLAGTDKSRIHIVNGYAGSGKTTLISQIIQALSHHNIRTALLAPTGRAAKVLSTNCQHPTFTIHKYIYKIFRNDLGDFKIILGKNRTHNTVFFIDEASMISANSEYAYGQNLLDDLVNFITSEPSSKMIIVGDNAQLPPVKEIESPALLKDTYKDRYSIIASLSTMEEVVRQVNDSPILANATFIRNKLLEKDFSTPFFTSTVKDVFANIDMQNFEDILNTSFVRHSSDSIIICRSNKQANMYNNAIRNRVLFYDSVLTAGEKIMVVKNNYFWLDESNETYFIANGEMLEVQKIYKTENLYGFNFARAAVKLQDYPNTPSIDVILLLDTLNVESASMSYEKKKELYSNIMEDYMHITDKNERNRAIKANPYYNALEIKYGYAVTCHKAQGGQWDNVFIDKGFVKDEDLNEDFFRWLYTAITRAVNRVYLINFDRDV